MSWIYRGLAGLLVAMSIVLVARATVPLRPMSLLPLLAVIPLTVYALGGQRALDRLLPMFRDPGDR